MSETQTDRLVDSIRERYREEFPVKLLASPAIETILNHRSVRNFRPDALPEGTLETLVAAAQSAPTSSNLQAWSVVAVTDKAKKARLAELSGRQKHIAAAPLFLVFIGDLSRAAQLGRQREMAMDGLDFVESFMLALIDATLAAQNATIAAESLGLGTVCIGAIRNNVLEVAEALALPPNSFPAFGMCIGYPDPTKPAAIKPRLAQDVVLHREQYNNSSIEPAIARYETASAAFRKSQSMSDIPWVTQMTQRLADAASLQGRDILRQALARMGFPLK